MKKKVLILRAGTISIVLLSIVLVASISIASAYDIGGKEFTNRKLITIDNTGNANTLTDYQLKIEVNHETSSPGNEPPVASFMYAPENPSIAPVEIQFDASASHDPDGRIVGYKWDFGDGEGTIGERVAHTYVGEGSYSAGLTVTDNGGATGSAYTTIVIVTEETIPEFSTIAIPVATILGLFLLIRRRKRE